MATWGATTTDPWAQETDRRYVRRRATDAALGTDAFPTSDPGDDGPEPPPSAPPPSAPPPTAPPPGAPPPANPSPVTATGGVPPWTGTGTAATYFGGAPTGSGTGGGTRRTDYTLSQAQGAIADAYKKLLGREASPAEIDAQLRGQGWMPGHRFVGSTGLESVLNSIWASDEAKKFREKGAGSTAPTPPAPPAPPGTPPPADRGVPPGTPAPAAATPPGATVAPGGAVGAAPPGAPTAAGGRLGRLGIDFSMPPLSTPGTYTLPGQSAPMTFTPPTPSDTTDTFTRIRGLLGTYTPAAISQFTAPDQSAATGATQAALLDALRNSEWSPERIAAMKETQKEQALSMEDALSEKLGQSFASRGRLGSGAHLGQTAQLGEATREGILGAYRDINEQAAAGRRSELLSTAAALESALTGQMGRATAGYGAQLAGQTAAADEGWRGWESGRSLYDIARQEAASRDALALESALGFADVNLRQQLGRDELAQRGALGMADIDLRQRLGRDDLALRGALGSQEMRLRQLLGLEGIDVEELLGLGAQAVDWGRIRESGRQSDNQLGYNWGALNAGLLGLGR